MKEVFQKACDRLENVEANYRTPNKKISPAEESAMKSITTIYTFLLKILGQSNADFSEKNYREVIEKVRGVGSYVDSGWFGAKNPTFFSTTIVPSIVSNLEEYLQEYKKNVEKNNNPNFQQQLSQLQTSVQIIRSELSETKVELVETKQELGETKKQLEESKSQLVVLKQDKDELRNLLVNVDFTCDATALKKLAKLLDLPSIISEKQIESSSSSSSRLYVLPTKYSFDVPKKVEGSKAHWKPEDYRNYDISKVRKSTTDAMFAAIVDLTELKNVLIQKQSSSPLNNSSATFGVSYKVDIATLDAIIYGLLDQSLVESSEYNQLTWSERFANLQNDLDIASKKLNGEVTSLLSEIQKFKYSDQMPQETSLKNRLTNIAMAANDGHFLGKNVQAALKYEKQLKQSVSLNNK